MKNSLVLLFLHYSNTESERLLTAVFCPKEVAVMGIGPYGMVKKKLYFAPVEAGILEPQTCLKNTLVNFSLHCKNSSGQVLSFLKATSSTICLACFTGKSSDIQFHIIRETTGVVNKIHKTLSPDIYFHGMIQCIIRVSLYSSETAEKYDFLNLGMGLMAKKCFTQ